MADNFLHRNDAPFGNAVWQKLDEAVIGAASSQLSARRLLMIEGPFGLGFKALPTEDAATSESTDMAASSVVPVAMLRSDFSLGVRDIAAFEQNGIPLPLGPVAESAIEVALMEDDLIFNGSKSVGVKGLLNSDGILSSKLSDWAEVGTAVDNVIKAVTTLDDAGFHGPYAAAFSAKRYNLLFRKYPNSEMTELSHIRQIATEGIFKTSAIRDGGVLIASGSQFARIVLGQDLMTSFIGPEVGSYQFMVSATGALRLIEPKSVCALKA
jgi:uncharacterized linocin/CFP29 family protein